VSFELYREALSAVHLQIRAALANWGVVRAAARTPALRDRIRGTLHSGYAAETILNSCAEAAMLAAARLWDDEARPPLCGTIANPLGRPERGYAIASLLHSAGVSEPDAENRIKAFGKCAKRQRLAAKKAHAALLPIRRRWLAHRQVAPLEEHEIEAGETHYHDFGGADFPAIHFLTLIYRAHVLASGADQLLDPQTTSEPFRTLRAEFFENGMAFWASYVRAPLSLDELGNPL
jgi:hypothetical protein